MEIPKGVKTTVTTLAILWLDSDGVLFVAFRPETQYMRSMDTVKELLEVVKVLADGKKICIIVISVKSPPPFTKEQREQVIKEANTTLKAMAVIAPSPASRMLANLFFTLTPHLYPVKMLKNEKEAKEWIKQYL